MKLKFNQCKACREIGVRVWEDILNSKKIDLSFVSYFFMNFLNKNKLCDYCQELKDTYKTKSKCLICFRDCNIKWNRYLKNGKVCKKCSIVFNKMAKERLIVENDIYKIKKRLRKECEGKKNLKLKKSLKKKLKALRTKLNTYTFEYFESYIEVYNIKKKSY